MKKPPRLIIAQVESRLAIKRSTTQRALRKHIFLYPCKIQNLYGIKNLKICKVIVQKFIAIINQKACTNIYARFFLLMRFSLDRTD